MICGTMHNILHSLVQKELLVLTILVWPAEYWRWDLCRSLSFPFYRMWNRRGRTPTVYVFLLIALYAPCELTQHNVHCTLWLYRLKVKSPRFILSLMPKSIHCSLFCLFEGMRVLGVPHRGIQCLAMYEIVSLPSIHLIHDLFGSMIYSV